MSKRERLEKQKLKQLEKKRLADLEEQKEKENAKKNKSKTALKSIKKSKRKDKPKENFGYLFAKIVMTIITIYSCVFYGTVTIIGIAKGYMENVPKSYAVIFTIGSILTAIGVIITYLKKYYVSFALILAGVLTYMKGTIYIINIISKKLEHYDGASSTIAKMDKTYMIRHYPILIILVISFILALITLIKFIKKKKKIKNQRDNAPVNSIIG